MKSIIEKMGYYQEYLEQYQTVMVKTKKHRIPESRLVKYWGFAIIPYWKTRSYKGVKYADLSTGDLEVD